MWNYFRDFIHICLYFQGWNKIRSELLRKDLHDILTEFRKLALSAATQSKAMKDAVAAIEKFQRKIRYADYQSTFDLQKILIKGLAGVKFSLDCYRNLVKAIKFMVDHCKKGDGQFTDLWDRSTYYFGLNSKSCRDNAGVPYTTKEKMENVIKIQAANNSFNPDCILNSKDIKYLACAKKYRGYKASEIATQLKLTVAQVNLLLPNCPPAPITPRTISTICILHKNKVSIDDIVAVTKVDFFKVAQIIVNKCARKSQPWTGRLVFLFSFFFYFQVFAGDFFRYTYLLLKRLIHVDSYKFWVIMLSICTYIWIVYLISNCLVLRIKNQLDILLLVCVSDLFSKVFQT